MWWQTHSVGITAQWTQQESKSTLPQEGEVLELNKPTSCDMMTCLGHRRGTMYGEINFYDLVLFFCSLLLGTSGSCPGDSPNG